MRIYSLWLSALLLLAGGSLTAQHLSPDESVRRTEDLGRQKDMEVSVLTRTPGGHDTYVLTASRGDADNKPGIAVIGGIEGPARYTVDLVLEMAEKLAASGSGITDTVTFYFFPDLTPDAGEACFEEPRYERRENASPFDDDNDGRKDEDGYDDLNGDGLITWMRIRDDTGEWIVHPDNPYVMVKAEASENEKGKYLLLKEGIDNDHDGRINEDVPGGEIFNRNFSFHYPAFAPGAGVNMMSAVENRALAGFLFDHWNIFAVLALGPDNNLSEYNDLKADLKDKSVPAEVQAEDRPFFEKVVHIYQNDYHLPDPKVVAPEGGDLLSWAYFHYNRFAFSTPAWNLKKMENDRGSATFDFLSGKSKKEMAADVVTWQKTDHPDFPGKIVEVGGIKPCVMNSPPESAMDSIVQCHYNFMLHLARIRPSLGIRINKVISRDKDLWQIEAEIVNTGGLPSMTRLAENSRWVRKIRVEMMPGSGNKIAGGRKVLLYERIDPGQAKNLSWLIRGNGQVKITAGSPQTGFINRIVELN